MLYYLTLNYIILHLIMICCLIICHFQFVIYILQFICCYSCHQIKYSYHLMRDDRYPLWEDKLNQKGGTWRLKCHKHDTVSVLIYLRINFYPYNQFFIFLHKTFTTSDTFIWQMFGFSGMCVERSGARSYRRTICYGYSAGWWNLRGDCIDSW